eukprot:scaffold111902_cov20-Tisochrysis_lutea.AAC.2
MLIQVEGPTQNQCMRVDIMLPSVDPALCAPFLAAGSSSGGNQTQEGHAAGSCPQAFGPVAIEFNGPDHYLAVPAYAPTGEGRQEVHASDASLCVCVLYDFEQDECKECQNCDAWVCRSLGNKGMDWLPNKQ